MFEKLRSLRNINGVSAEKMAEILGLETKAAYYKKETGSVKFSLEDAKKVADFFHMPIENIFLGIGFPNRNDYAFTTYSIFKTEVK